LKSLARVNEKLRQINKNALTHRSADIFYKTLPNFLTRIRNKNSFPRNHLLSCAKNIREKIFS